MPPKKRTRTNPQLTLTQEDVNQLMQDGIAVAIREERERVRREATRAEGHARDSVTGPIARECLFVGFIKYGPTQFHRTEGAVGLVRWFEKMENTFEISESPYTKRFNELALLCPDAVPNEKKKVELYIKGANQAEVTPKCNHCGKCHFYQCPTRCENYGKLGHKAKDCRGKNVAPGAAVQPNIV
nr:hypothetical protein [Tanacetum cinerariifolium]